MSLNAVPIEIFSQICRHGDGRDLIQLTRVSKTFRSILLGDNGLHVWKSVRFRDGIPDLKNPMTELGYATLLYGKNCYRCQKTANWNYVPMKWSKKYDYVSEPIKTNFFLRARICQECFDYELGLQKSVLVPHKSTFRCVPNSGTLDHGDFIRIANPSISPKFYLLYRDVVRIDKQLKDFEAQKELRTTQQASNTTETSSDVEDFVERRREFVRSFRRDGQILLKLPAKLAMLEATRARAQKVIDKRRVAARLQEIEAVALSRGYSQEEVNCIINPYRNDTYVVYQHLNLSSFFDPPRPLFHTDWDLSNVGQALEYIRVQLQKKQAEKEKEESQRAFEDRQEIRRLLLKPYYDHLYLTSTGQFQPLFLDFLQFPSMKNFWIDDGSDVTDESWKNQLQRISDDVKIHQEKVRIETVRMIVSSTTKKTKFKANEGFPEENYGNDFLNQSIAILACDYCAKDDKRHPFYDYYPSILNHTFEEHSEKSQLFSTFKSQKLLGYSISRKQVKALEHLFEVAELDSKTNTLADLDALGPRFKCDLYKPCAKVGIASQMLHLSSGCTTKGDKFTDQFKLLQKKCIVVEY